MKQGDIVAGIIGDDSYMYVNEHIRLRAPESVLQALTEFEINSVRALLLGNHNARAKAQRFLSKRGIEAGVKGLQKGPKHAVDVALTRAREARDRAAAKERIKAALMATAKAGAASVA